MRTLALSALLLALPLGASAQATEIQETLRQAHPAIRACVEKDPSGIDAVGKAFQTVGATDVSSIKPEDRAAIIAALRG